MSDVNLKLQAMLPKLVNLAINEDLQLDYLFLDLSDSMSVKAKLRNGDSLSIELGSK